MRFNKQELLTLATQPSQEFDKEGILFLRERQDGFFRRTEILLERWCRLRGNLLFYFKNRDLWSEPVGVVVLEQFTIKVDPPSTEPPFGFTVAFEGGLGQHIGSNTESERDAWIEAIEKSNYYSMRAKLRDLEQRIELKRGHDPDLDVHMWRLRRGNTIDPNELPICEVSLMCDNLLCDGNGRPPNPIIVAHVFIRSAGIWLKYSNTEIIQVHCHRRSQSLPPRLGCKLKLPRQGEFKQIFGNPAVHTYRFHSGLGGDISVHEIMAESMLCFTFPQQLVGIWINEEKELLQEVAAMGELVEPWHSLQVELLDRHLQLLHLYSQAKENLQAHRGSFFKPSSRKFDRSLEFAPVNLHLQRMWVQNESLKKCDFYDIITVGAFTAHSHKSKNGGLIKLLQQVKECPNKEKAPSTDPGVNKIALAHDAIQAIKQLRREVVDSMRTLMKLAKDKKTAGMLPICDEMVLKTRTLLTLWDSSLVEEALSFVEEHKVTPSTSVSDIGMSPFRRITQQLQFTNLKSPDADDPVTPDSPSAHAIHSFFKVSHGTSRADAHHNLKLEQDQFVIFPDAEEDEKKPIDVNSNNEENKNGDMRADEDDMTEEEITLMAQIPNGHDSEKSRMFLDTHAMCSSPSANYYKPTDEPEPWDLTQLNIEASVMCLVSKVKFLCGRCSSPAVRLRNTQRGIGRSQSFRSELCNQQQEAVVLQPSSRLSSRTSSDDNISQAVESANAVRNKFTEGEHLEQFNISEYSAIVSLVYVRNLFPLQGLELCNITDWTRELRPSMKKLRQAMDGLLKTARLTHSVFRLQEDKKAAQRSCNVRYRRHVCFSHALTSLVTGLMAKLWCQKPDPTFIHIVSTLGPLVSFEGLLSYYGDEIDMWGDMVVAIEDLKTVSFVLVPSSPSAKGGAYQPRVIGPRSSLSVHLPVPESVHSLLPLPSSTNHFTFHVTPVFFNIGINELASLAENLGSVKPQERSNVDNFCRLNEYYHHYRKLGLVLGPSSCYKGIKAQNADLSDLMNQLKSEVESSKGKNVAVLQLAAVACRKMKGECDFVLHPASRASIEGCTLRYDLISIFLRYPNAIYYYKSNRSQSGAGRCYFSNPIGSLPTEFSFV
ncbi:unnamed protein product [Nesidiocoris tenuis]|uniref:PH domain-containing protein n=1 Tax=Nesidiocoris tenuis TaxID=355587 RepID=A0A6H5GCF7_9HEMI|nr:unnamed protein product [Nesidiocoris tenuis]